MDCDCSLRAARVHVINPPLRHISDLVKQKPAQSALVNQTCYAIRVFQLNVELNPDSANTHDSLGETCMASGDNAQAVKNCEYILSSWI